MKRRLFNLLAAVSLVLCVATAACWTLSCRTGKKWYCSLGSYNIRSFGGRVYLEHVSGAAYAGAIENGWKFVGGSYSTLTDTTVGGQAYNVTETFSHFSGVRYGGTGLTIGAGATARPFYVRILVIPYWLLMIACWVPALFPIRWRQFPAGHCRKCGYDLRASKERCPECGTAIPEQTMSAER